MLSTKRNKSRGTTKNYHVVASRLIAVMVLLAMVADAWKQCPEEEGGGICPDYATCCPTGTPGISSCVSGKKKYPEDARGQCCDPEGLYGCAYGYECARKEEESPSLGLGNPPQGICKLQDEHPPDLNAKETPMYELCRMPHSLETLKLHSLPIGNFNATYYSSMGSLLPSSNHSDDMQKFASIERVLVIVHGSGRNADDYLCTGVSVVEAEEERNKSRNAAGSIYEKTLVIAPKFVADVDEREINNHPNTLYWLERRPDAPMPHTWRYGADAINTQSQDHPGISSYAVMDRLLEVLLSSKGNSHEHEGSIRGSAEQEDSSASPSSYLFPNLKRIVVAGHSAGGQLVHRWSLLSSSQIIWGDDILDDDDCPTTIPRNVEIRAVVANPRCYCYLDNRRMIRSGDNSPCVDGNDCGSAGIATNTHRNLEASANLDPYIYKFAVPDREEIDKCPGYDQWQWGLEPGSKYIAPYRDASMDHLKNDTSAMARRYSQRRVYYMVGEHDTIVQNDRCETYNFQGDTRNERARRYFSALTEYFASPEYNIVGTATGTLPSAPLIHEFHEVPESPHDHTLMFQSAPAKEAFFGKSRKNSMKDERGPWACF